MKKLKKYIYPFAFSIGFFLFYIILAITINTFNIGGQDYGGLAIALLIIILWILVVIPIFCLKYCKLIRQEKYKLLFGFYNPLVIALSYTAPFFEAAVSGSDGDVLFWIAVILFGWVAIWTLVPLIAKEQGDNKSNEIQE